MKELETEDAGEDVVTTLLRLADLAGADSDLERRGRFLSVDCVAGTATTPVHLEIRHGRLTGVTRGPLLMRSARFAFRAKPSAWRAYWKAEPRPGFHDLLALTKRGDATLEGDLHPFITNLQYFKDLLALPRGLESGR